MNLFLTRGRREKNFSLFTRRTGKIVFREFYPREFTNPTILRGDALESSANFRSSFENLYNFFITIRV